MIFINNVLLTYYILYSNSNERRLCQEFYSLRNFCNRVSIIQINFLTSLYKAPN